MMAKVELTRREIEVLTLIARGAANKDIAVALNRSVKTVEFHVSNLLRKHEVATRLELVVAILQNRTAPHEPSRALLA